MKRPLYKLILMTFLFGFSEISQPAVEKGMVSEVLGLGDVEKMNKSAVLEGEKAALEGRSVELVEDSSAAVDSGGHKSAVEAGAFDTDYKKALLEGLEDNSEVPASVENPGITLEDKGAVDAKLDEHVGLLAAGNEPDEDTVKDKGAEGVELIDTTAETNGVVELAEGTSVLSNDADHLNQPSQPEIVVEADGEKITPEGDSVVGAIDVDLVAPGVAVISETTDEEVVEEKERELAVSDGETLMTTADSNPSVNDDRAVEAINADVVAPGVVVVGETGENKLTEVKEEELAVPDDETLVATNDSKFAVLEDNVDVSNTEVDKPSSEAVAGEDIKMAEQLPAEAENGEKLDTGDSVEASGTLNDLEHVDADNIGMKLKSEVEKPDVSETKENGTTIKIEDDEVVVDGDGVVNVESNGLVDGRSAESHSREYSQTTSMQKSLEILEHQAKDEMEEEADNVDRSFSDAETDDMVFQSSEAAKQFIEELERASGVEGSHDSEHRIDGQIATDSDEEVDTDDEGEGKELFDSAALAALLKAATGAEAEGGSIRINSQDGSRLFSVERPAGLGSSVRSFRPATQPNRPNIFGSSSLSNSGDVDSNLSDEEKKKLETLQQIRVKFLRLVHRLGLSSDEHVVSQVLYRLALLAGRQNGQVFSIDTAKRTALQLEEKEQDDLDFSVSILVLGKCGVGKSATINSIFGEEKTPIGAFKPATSKVKEIVGYVDGVKIKVYDTPGLKCSAIEQNFNRRVMSSIKKYIQKNPPDVVLYVDRLDSQSRDLNDLPILKIISSILGPSILRSSIVTLTHAGCAPPEGGPSGTALNYDVFVTQRSHVVQQLIGNALNDLRMVSPSLMNPVSLVENHPSCRRNREGKKVLPNGMSWKPQLLLLCYSMKILSEANSLTKSQDPFDHRKLFGFRGRSPPLPYVLSSMLQSRTHPKLPSDQGGDNVDSDIDLDDLDEIDQDEEAEYDQLPPFKPLSKYQLDRLSKEQRKAYFDEYDYRVKLLQKKQWMEELRRMKEMKKKGKDGKVEYGYGEEEEADVGAANVAVPLPDMVLPPTFDSDNPSYRYRILEPTSQFLARPVLDNLGWDHDCGYDGVNVEQSLAIANHYPAAVTVQITKDKKDFTISLDSSVSTKHGEKGSSMAGFDVQSIGKQLAYVVRGETKFKNLKKNKMGGGMSMTFMGENVIPGIKIDDHITLGKKYVLVGSAGLVRSQKDTALGANFEFQKRDDELPIGQVQSTVNMSVIKWRGDLALGLNCQTQFSAGRGSKVAVRAGINNKLSGQLTVRTSSSEHLSLALVAFLPTAMSIYRKFWPGAAVDKYSMY